MTGKYFQVVVSNSVEKLLNGEYKPYSSDIL
jgi:hypothetical protein